MSSRFINKYAGAGATDAPINRSKAAGIGYDSVLGKFNYNDGGTLREVFNRSNAPIVVTAATLTLSAALHDGFLIVQSLLAGCTFTLPAATGSGARFQIFVGLSLTSGSLIVQAGNALDYLRGQAYSFVTTTASTFGTTNTGTVATESDTLTFNRTTTGLGTIGDYIELTDIAAHVWAVEADYASSGTAATPFSAAV